MKRIVFVLLGVIWSLAAFGQQPTGIFFTYIANEGFLIQDGDKKILIDALFDCPQCSFCDIPSPELLAQMECGAPPFDGIDLILVTHAHRDHFSADCVGKAMLNSPDCRLVCAEQASGFMIEFDNYNEIKDRVIEITPERNSIIDTTVNGIDMNIAMLQHGPFWQTDPESGEKIDRHRNIQDLAFRIHLSQNVLHIGDASVLLSQNCLRQLGPVDIACIQRYERSRDALHLLTDELHAKNLVYMHMDIQGRDEIIQDIEHKVPNGIVFTRAMQKKMF